MAGRASLVRAEPGYSLPFFDRLAPPPPPGLVAARVETHSAPGDIVLDLAGRGGWVARAAVDRQRRAVSLETTPLTRLLAELVLRPPDLRHLDAAFQAMGASPRGQTSLKVAVGQPFVTRCATCGRSLTIDEIVWGGTHDEGADDGSDTDEGTEKPVEAASAPGRKFYACPVCRGGRGGEQRSADIDDGDRDRARAIPDDYTAVRSRLRDRFPVVEGGTNLGDSLLDLHTPRQLVGLEAILDRIEGDLRAAPVEAALRLAFLQALLPASRLNGYPGRIGTLRIQGGRVRPPGHGQWRERNPWLAFEDGIRTVRGFIQRLESGPGGAVQARLGEDLRSLTEGSATAVVRVAGPSTTRAIGEEAALGRGWETGPSVRRRVRLVLGQPPVRPNQERLSLTYWATAWTIGREGAGALPLAALSGAAIRAPWGWQAAALGRSLASVEPSVARDGRVVYLVDGGAEALVTAALGGVGAGFRLLAARLGEGDDEAVGTVELVPPGAVLPPGPRTRANVSLDPIPGGAGDPDMVPGAGLFTAPERFDRRPFTASEVNRTIVDVAVESLKARGEPATQERLLGEILVGLDRAGQLRRLVVDRGLATAPDDDAGDAEDSVGSAEAREPIEPAGDRTSRSARLGSPMGPGEPSPKGDRAPVESSGSAIRTRRLARTADAPPDQVEGVLAMIGEGLAEHGKRRLAEVAPRRWWLADARDREAAAAPLADRVEWAVFSLLSTAGPLSETAFLQRIATLFTGHDLPDETLVRACLQSYRSRASTADRIVTGDDLLRRAQDHAELIGLLTDAGHRLGLSVWIGRREQVRRLGAGRLGDRLDEHERTAYLAHISRAVDSVAEIDCAWYARGRMSFLFEVEWTAMLGEPVLRRHARIPQEEGTVRFLVVAPERTELVRHKLDRSPLLREAFERDNWHVIKWNHLRSFVDRDELSLDALEPYLGLDPQAERSGEQLDLFNQ
ncbi:MAG TPA: hypothetical protein VHS36_02780 [Candidatus Limnocylindrales bacterium]|nr:hypothetical protein [Candidatus Limnocylindrales bacterium]